MVQYIAVIYVLTVINSMDRMVQCMEGEEVKCQGLGDNEDKLVQKTGYDC